MEIALIDFMSLKYHKKQEDLTGAENVFCTFLLKFKAFYDNSITTAG